MIPAKGVFIEVKMKEAEKKKCMVPSLRVTWLAGSDASDLDTRGSITGYVYDTKVPTLFNNECVDTSYQS